MNDPLHDFVCEHNLCYDELIETIERFKAERLYILDKWESIGFDDGKSWALSVSFVEIENYAANMQERILNGTPWPDIDNWTMFVEMFDNDPDWCPSAEQGFWKGFAKGVLSIWNVTSNHF